MTHKHLTIGETAKRLGLEVDTLRKLERAGKIRAVRTRGGHRRFAEAEIERFRKAHRRTSGTKPRAAKPRHTTRHQATSRPIPARHPRTGEFVSPDLALPDDLEVFDEEIPVDEFDEVFSIEPYVPPPPATASAYTPPAPSAPMPPLVRFEPRPVPAPPRHETESGSVNQFRLQLLKYEGRAAMPRNLPAEWQGKVIADLERYVTPTQFPADLSSAKAGEIVRARVAEVLRPYHETEEKARRAKQAHEQADHRRHRLITHGNNYAWQETTDWDWSARSDARAEVTKILEREVQHEWTEYEVEDAVDRILDEWEEDDEEGEDDE